eukprot:1920248-Prymnesium_polylepis.2
MDQRRHVLLDRDYWNGRNVPAVIGKSFIFSTQLWSFSAAASRVFISLYMASNFWSPLFGIWENMPSRFCRRAVARGAKRVGHTTTARQRGARRCQTVPDGARRCQT